MRVCLLDINAYYEEDEVNAVTGLGVVYIVVINVERARSSCSKMCSETWMKSCDSNKYVVCKSKKWKCYVSVALSVAKKMANPKPAQPAPCKRINYAEPLNGLHISYAPPNKKWPCMCVNGGRTNMRVANNCYTCRRPIVISSDCMNWDYDDDDDEEEEEERMNVMMYTTAPIMTLSSVARRGMCRVRVISFRLLLL